MLAIKLEIFLEETEALKCDFPSQNNLLPLMVSLVKFQKKFFVNRWRELGYHANLQVQTLW
jgi:hypothetical protein